MIVELAARPLVELKVVQVPAEEGTVVVLTFVQVVGAVLEDIHMYVMVCAVLVHAQPQRLWFVLMWVGEALQEAIVGLHVLVVESHLTDITTPIVTVYKQVRSQTLHIALIYVQDRPQPQLKIQHQPKLDVLQPISRVHLAAVMDLSAIRQQILVELPLLLPLLLVVEDA